MYNIMHDILTGKQLSLQQETKGEKLIKTDQCKIKIP